MNSQYRKMWREDNLMKNGTKIFAFVMASACSIATSHAREGSASASKVADQSDDFIQDIIVTARKKEERLQDVPVAISALSGDSLHQSGTVDIKAVASLSPGVFYRAADRRVPSLYIRGFGTRSFTDEADSSIGTFVDGVYIARFSSALQEMFDVERVEVLKGPQGTLFGRNTIGGTLNVVTASPTDEFRAG
jgi:iron complex outermembrane recepter protein